ncbi:MAG: hypothetical protein IID33_12685 [Planctomycetes bacterium]|nr:hypothetical protein [Planctomycetota bacterium]
MNLPVLAFFAAVLAGAALGGSKKRTDAQCLRVLGEQLFETTVTASPAQRADIIAWLNSVGLQVTAQCMLDHAANLAPCRELIIAAVQLDLQTRDATYLLDLAEKARAKGLRTVAGCLVQLSGAVAA